MTILKNIILPDGPVKLTASGTISSADIIKTLHGLLQDSQFKSGMDILWDFRQVKTENMKADQIREIVSFIKNNQEKRGAHYRVALVVSRDIDFGLARMYEAYTQELPFQLQIFKTLSSAEDWLNTDV
jgi:hypothetical protein